MRTKGPLLLMAIFLICLGAFIMWGATILFRIAAPPAVLFVLLSLFCTGFGLYFIFKTIKHFGSVRQLVNGNLNVYQKTEKLTSAEIGLLEKELQAVNKWTRKNIAFGVFFIVVSCCIPTQYLGLHSLVHSYGTEGGYETLVQKTGGMILFAVVFCIEAFLLYNAVTDRKNIHADLQELRKIRLAGIVRGVEVEKFNKQKGTLVMRIEGMELEHEIDLLYEKHLDTGTEIHVDLAIHSQTILAVEAVSV